MTALQNVSQFFLKIDGKDSPPEMDRDIAEVVVDSSLHMPDMFTIRLQDYEFEWVDNTKLFDIGKEVEISAQVAEDRGGEKGPLLHAKITALEPDFSAQGLTSFVIRGYDKSNQLHLGRKTRTFTQQSDEQIIKKIAGENGLSADVDKTGVVYEYVMQYNQTDMEFISERAQRIGYQVYVVKDKLFVKKGDATAKGKTPELALGEDLLSFRPRMTAANQASKVQLMGWDDKKKQPIKAVAQPNKKFNQGGMKKTGGAVTKSAFGAVEDIIVDYPVETVDEAKAMAKGLADDISSQFVEADGVCYGNPHVKAGTRVKLTGLGKRFSGEYFVTSATHTLNQSGYETRFSVSGRQPDTLNHLLEKRHKQSDGRIQGVVAGLVTNLNDKENLGRVKVKYAWLGEIESAWARIATPMAGQDNKGFYFLPEINDEVLVAFAHGDVNHPYVVGYLWNNKDKPPQPNSKVVKNGKVVQRMIQSRAGHQIILDDSDDKPSIQIIDKTGKNKIIIDSSKNSMAIHAEKDLTLDVGGNLTLKAGGAITIDSGKDLKAKAKTNLTLDAGANGALKSKGKLDIKSGAAVAVAGAAKAELKGATVSVAGSAMTEVKGALVKIN